MKRSDEIRQLLAEKRNNMRTLADTAKGRAMTAEERASFTTAKDEISGLNDELESALTLEAEEMQAAQREAEQRGKAPSTGGQQREEDKIKKQYSLLRAINLATQGKSLDGLEKEMQQEAENEARASGLNTSGQIQIPAMLSRSFNPERRDMTAGTTTAGGFTVQTDLGDLIPILEPQLMVESMGATMLRGLTGNLDIPRNDADAAAVWEGENDANAETSPTFDRIQLSPNRLGAFTDISKQVMVQSSIDMENFIRRRLNFAIAKALDYAALNGSGSGNQPLGILGTSGIGSVVGGTNGATPDWADIVDLESALTTDNADLGRLGYLTTPGVRGYLKKTLLDAGSGQFIWPQNATEINGYNVGTSTQVPSDLTKGSATAICHAIIFGNWEDLIIAQWGGLDIVVDPYSGSKNALVTLVVNSWWDTAVRHPESFAAMKDALIS
jgi:HK97 family phage major capsid protein